MKKLFPFFIVTLMLASCSKNNVLRFEVFSGDLPYFDCPVEVDISSLKTILNEIPEEDFHDQFILKELSNGRITEVPFQIKNNEKPVLWFVMEGITYENESRNYRLFLSDEEKEYAHVDYSLDEDELIFSRKGQELLSYRISEMAAPEGIDPLYKRSAYIHPIITPGGEVLTRIQPPDHYHHYGLWNPWTKTHINGREIDYWNLAKGQGTVRHKALEYLTDGTIFGEFIASHEYIDFGSSVPERVCMQEEWRGRIWNTVFDGKRYTFDLRTSLENVLSDTIIFDAYRYGGGIGFRATSKWNAENSRVLTSEGMDRMSADGTRARWCLIEGESDTKAGKSGILFLSHIDNREHPEPMRVWPDSVNNGEVFFEFCPIREKDWIIEPSKEYELKYRMIIYDGKMTVDEAEMYWNGFVKMPMVEIR